jgi:hypothetical protein
MLVWWPLACTICVFVWRGKKWLDCLRDSEITWSVLGLCPVIFWMGKTASRLISNLHGTHRAPVWVMFRNILPTGHRNWAWGRMHGGDLDSCGRQEVRLWNFMTPMWCGGMGQSARLRNTSEECLKGCLEQNHIGPFIKKNVFAQTKAIWFLNEWLKFSIKALRCLWGMFLNP